MGEKVILTQKQGIELAAMKYSGMSLEEWVNRKNNPCEPRSCIDDLTLDEMAKALYAGDYEVEKPEIEIDDMVVRIDGQSFLDGGEIQRVTEIRDKVLILKTGYQYTWDFIRKATPEEIYWLHELKRKKVPDFKIGDVFVDRLNAGYRLNEEQNVKDFISYYEEDDFRGIYPAESFKPYIRNE